MSEDKFSYFIGLDIGPSWAVPEIKAGGAVVEPFPSIWIFTFGKTRVTPAIALRKRGWPLIEVRRPIMPTTISFFFGSFFFLWRPVETVGNGGSADVVSVTAEVSVQGV